MLPVPLYFTHVSKIYKELIPYYEQNTIRNAAESPTGSRCAVSGVGTVSYTHLDVYKRQGYTFQYTDAFTLFMRNL